MKNETDSKISAFLRLAELCGTGDERKKKYYMSEVEKLLGCKEEDVITKEVKRICDEREKEGGLLSLWILVSTYKDEYWSKKPFNALDRYEISEYFFSEFIKRNVVVSEDFEFGKRQGFSFEPSEKTKACLKRCGW